MNKVIETHSLITKQPGVMVNELGVIGEISQDIASILDTEGRGLVINNQNILKGLLQELELEVKRISDELGYNYSTTGYKGRLTKSREFINNQLISLLSKQPRLKELNDNILNFLDTNNINKGLLDSIFINLFEDLIYESFSEEDEKINYDYCLDLADDILLKLLDEDTDFSDLLSKYGDTEMYSLDFTQSDLSLLDINQLEKIFGLFKSIRFINFRGVPLAAIEKNNFMFIVKQLSNVKEIKLNRCDLFVTLDRKLLIIFLKSLINLRKISLLDTGLDKLSNEVLFIIFSNLHGVKGIGLGYNRFYLIDIEGLEIIFSNLQDVRYIDLDGCNISGMSHEQLNTIFSKLGNVQQICLSGNTIGLLDDEGLRIIFSNLKNARYIEIHADRIDDRQEKYIRSLCSCDINF